VNQRKEEDHSTIIVILLVALLLIAALIGYLMPIITKSSTTSTIATSTTSTSTTPVSVSTTSTIATTGPTTTGSTTVSSTTTSYTSKIMGYTGFIKESVNVSDYSSTNYKKLNMILNITFPFSFAVNSSGLLFVTPPQNATYHGYYTEVLNNMSCAPSGWTSNISSGSLSGNVTFNYAALFNKTLGQVVLQIDQWRMYGNGLPDNCSGRGPSVPSTPDNGLGVPGFLLLGQVMGPNESSGVMSQIGRGSRIYSNPYDGAFYGFLLHGYEGQSLIARYVGSLAYWHCSGESACGGGNRNVSFAMVVNLSYSS
jgi:hypothetical protein